MKKKRRNIILEEAQTAAWADDYIYCLGLQKTRKSQWRGEGTADGYCGEFSSQRTLENQISN